MEFFPILIFVVFLILIGVGAYFAHLAQKKRREALSQLADELGWRFDSSYDYDHDDQFANFEIFRRGHSRVAYNTLHGSMTLEGHQHPVKMGDFRYKVTSGSGKSRSTRTYTFSYLIVQLPFLHLPALLIRPEGMFDRLKGMFGFDDIDFESSEFSQQFYVSGSDKRFAYDVVHPRMMEFLLETRPPMIDIEHGRCCLSDGSTRWEPEQFRQMLQWIPRFLDLWPRHILADLETRS